MKWGDPITTDNLGLFQESPWVWYCPSCGELMSASGLDGQVRLEVPPLMRVSQHRCHVVSGVVPLRISSNEYLGYYKMRYDHIKKDYL